MNKKPTDSLEEKINRYFVFMLLCMILHEVAIGLPLRIATAIGAFYFSLRVTFCFICQGLLWLKKRWREQ